MLHFRTHSCTHTSCFLGFISVFVDVPENGADEAEEQTRSSDDQKGRDVLLSRAVVDVLVS